MSMLCSIDFSNLHTILRSLYDEMMPLCEDMTGVAQGIAGLGALFYVAYRIWHWQEPNRLMCSRCSVHS